MSDQLQQSAALFSCKTRRVAVYVETYYNSNLKVTGVLDRLQFVLVYLCLF